MDFVRLSALENRNTEAIFSPPKWSNSLDASVRIHTSEYVCVRLRTSAYCLCLMTYHVNLRLTISGLDILADGFRASVST